MTAALMGAVAFGRRLADSFDRTDRIMLAVGAVLILAGLVLIAGGGSGRG
ncbi:hypothetical protein OHA21_43735 [Actinoplanes sp. NBC_00393]